MEALTSYQQKGSNLNSLTKAAYLPVDFLNRAERKAVLQSTPLSQPNSVPDVTSPTINFSLYRADRYD